MRDSIKEARQAYDERMAAQGWITLDAFADMLPIGFSRSTLLERIKNLRMRKTKVFDYPEINQWGKVFISKEDAEAYADRIRREGDMRKSGEYIPLQKAVAMFKDVAEESTIIGWLNKCEKGGRDLYLRKEVENMARKELKIWKDAGLKRSECVGIDYILANSRRKRYQIMILIKTGVWNFRGVKYLNRWYYLKTDVDRVISRRLLHK